MLTAVTLLARPQVVVLVGASGSGKTTLRQRLVEEGLPAVAVLTPAVPLDELLARDRARPADERVPADVVARQHHRRSLLTPELLRDEGFGDVLTPPPVEPPLLIGRAAPHSQ